MEEFELSCMGETHKIRVVRGSLAFFGHTPAELDTLEAIGERVPCVRFRDEWKRRSVLDALDDVARRCEWDDTDRVVSALARHLGMSEDDADRLIGVLAGMQNKQDQRWRRVRNAPSDPLRERVERRLLWRAWDVIPRAAREVEMQIYEEGPLEAGAPVRALWIVSSVDRMAGETVKVGRDGMDVEVLVGFRWFREIFSAGRAFLGRRLVLGRVGDEWEILWLRSRTGKARARFVNGRWMLSPRNRLSDFSRPESSFMRVAA